MFSHSFNNSGLSVERIEKSTGDFSVCILVYQLYNGIITGHLIMICD